MHILIYTDIPMQTCLVNNAKQECIYLPNVFRECIDATNVLSLLETTNIPSIESHHSKLVRVDICCFCCWFRL